MPRLFGRLWRSGGRRAELAESVTPDADPGGGAREAPERGEEMGRRLEEARRRLRQTIASPEEPDDLQT